MISWGGTVNIPVEDNSYKWSKKIYKTQAAPQFETDLTKTHSGCPDKPRTNPFQNNCDLVSEIPALKM
jgi:hypothetical protein